jgi:hypothetical protein
VGRAKRNRLRNRSIASRPSPAFSSASGGTNADPPIRTDHPRRHPGPVRRSRAGGRRDGQGGNALHHSVGRRRRDTPGDPDGSGTASVTIDPDSGKVCWDINVSNIADATQSHIHVGAAGVSGDVVVPLDVDGFKGSTQGCVEGQDKPLLAKIIANPAGYYVNVHTDDFKPGAVRGQLAAGAPNTAMAPPASSPLTLLGMLLLLAAAVAGLRFARPILTRR